MISIIVPVYRVEAYLHRCLDSILGQSYGDYELILVDDGSPDRSGAICDAYAAGDNRIHVIHKQNGGVSAARNSGIEWVMANSSSQWLTFIDSDDWVHRDYLKVLMDAAQAHHVDVSMCGLYWTECFCEDAPLEPVKPVLLDGDQTFAQYYDICNCIYNKLFRRELFGNVRFPEDKAYAEDASVTPRLLCAAEKIAVVPQNLYYYFGNPEGAVRAKWSERKLQAIEVHEWRLQFFREQGCMAAYRRQKEGYVEELTEKIRNLLDSRESEQDYQDTLVMLREKLRIALKSAREDGMAPFNRENLWCYLYAMKTDAVWKAARKLHKLYRKVKK
ncbi:MAG: glycosyltransferase family 2 protein [Faecousia sp.]